MCCVFLSGLLLALSLLAPPTFAADTQERYVSIGLGSDACREITGAGGLTVSAASWLGGYLTALNTVLPNTYDILGGTDFRHAVTWIEQYCRRHPSERLAEAAEAFYDQAHATRTTTAPGQPPRRP